MIGLRRCLVSKGTGWDGCAACEMVERKTGWQGGCEDDWLVEQLAGWLTS